MGGKDYRRENYEWLQFSLSWILEILLAAKANTVDRLAQFSAPLEEIVERILQLQIREHGYYKQMQDFCLSLTKVKRRLMMKFCLCDKILGQRDVGAYH